MHHVRVIFAGCVLFWVSANGVAQDRMPPIPEQGLTEAQKEAADELIAGRRGSLAGPFVPLLRSPEFMSRLQKMGEYLRFDSSLGSRLNELVILITARKWTQQYEWYVHYPLALKAGVTPGLLEAISEGRQPVEMTQDEELVYDFCMELHRNQSVSDTTYARAVERFGEQGVIDMIGVTGYYSMLAMVMNVAKTPLPKGKTPALTLFPD